MTTQTINEVNGTQWEVLTDASSVHVVLRDTNGNEIASRRRLYKDSLMLRDPIELTNRLMTEIRLEVKRRSHE